jgi:aminomethyltransferase
MKRSPLFMELAAHNPKLAVVQGWEVANEYTTAREEHMAVRERVGLVDWSTTGEYEIQGPDALDVVQGLIVNDASAMPVNRVLYTTMLDDTGSIISDITVYRLGPEHYMLMTAWGSNAAGGRAEYDLLVAHSKGKNACVHDASPGSVLMALQGPRSRDLLAELTDADLANLKYMWAMPAQAAGVPGLISRTGYTGELGYEILVSAPHGHHFWDVITTAGTKYDMALVGLEACFSLRMEKGYIMRFDFAGGHTPYEIGLGWSAKLDKGDFVGREALVRRKAAGFADKLVAIAISDGYVPPTGDTILVAGESVGQTTSAAFGYAVGHAITLGYLPVALAQAGTKVEIQDSDGNLHPGTVSKRSLYDPERKRLFA